MGPKKDAKGKSGGGDTKGGSKTGKASSSKVDEKGKSAAPKGANAVKVTFQ